MISNQSFSMDPEILGGVPVFTGTRVPMHAMVDYFASGQTLDAFLEDFPTVTREQALAALSMMEQSLHAHPH